MSYNTIAICAVDDAFISRIASCAAQEGAPTEPRVWAAENAWVISATPEIEAAYAYALDTGNVNPGGDEDAITDNMILAAVQPMIMGTVENP